MPANVLLAKDGTIFDIGTYDVLGTFKTGEVRVTQAVVEHHGPDRKSVV